MAPQKAAKAAAAVAAGDPRKSERLGGAFDTTNSRWRKQFKVHHAADAFPIMSDAELDELGKDIKAHGLREPILLQGDWLIDGRNRVEAWVRAVRPIEDIPRKKLPASADVATVILSANGS